MNNKVVYHSNGKITRADLNDGLYFHKQNAAPTAVSLPHETGQYVLYTDGNNNYAFEKFQQKEQESIKLVPNAFNDENNQCCFTKGYPSILVAESANNWMELKLSTNTYQIIRYTDGVFDTVNLSNQTVASAIGMNRTNTTVNTLLYVDGATGTENKVVGIPMNTSGYYMLYNNYSKSCVEAMYVNALNLFNRSLGLNSNGKGMLVYSENKLSKVNMPTTTGYHVINNSNGTYSFTKPELITLISDEDTQNDYKTNNTGIPYLKNGKISTMFPPAVTQATNCIVTVNTDKSMQLVPLSNTDMNQVSFERLLRSNTTKSISGETNIELTELFPAFTTKTTGVYEVCAHVVMYIEDTSVFDNITSDNLCTITLSCGDHADTMYLMNPQDNIVNIKLSVLLAPNTVPTLTFNLRKVSGCKVIPNVGNCVVKQFSNM